MATPAEVKEARLNFRVSPDIKDRVEKAARLSGLTLTDFAVSVLNETATEVLDRHHVAELSNRDRDMFLAMLDERAKPNALLKRAKQTHRKLITK